MSGEIHALDDYLDDGALTNDGWTRALREGTLLGQRCAACGAATAAPKAACARCGSRDLEPVELPTEGEVYSETTIAVPPAGFSGRYQVAIVSLGDAQVMAQIDGSVEIGDDVELQGIVESDERPAPLFG